MSVCCCSLVGTKACETCLNNRDRHITFKQDSLPIDFVFEDGAFIARSKNTYIKKEQAQLEKLESFFEELKKLSEDELSELLTLVVERLKDK
jgi:hypothetical protein